MGLASLVLAASLSGPWTGSYSLGGPAQLAFTVAGNRATVALGVGHAGAQSVRLSAAGGRIVFRLPGAPAPLVFRGKLAGNRIRGTVRQGGAHGTFQAGRGTAPALFAPGLYTAGARTLAVVDDPYGPARLVDLDTGGVRALYRSGASFVVGAGFATRDPSAGSARFARAGATIQGAPAARLATRQLEVRFRSGGATLSGTLTLPPGPGPYPAVAWVTGSGRTTRAYLPDLLGLLLHHGVAVLAYDKRGVGQSGGSYPGESAIQSTIDVLARDADAAVRFLAARPEIDPNRVGLAGHSQAGWIIPLAASRDTAVRFAVIFSGPAVTADENDHYQNLTGEGEAPPTLSPEAIDARVLAEGPGGVDPIPWIRALRIPVLWLYGGLDQHVPPRLSVLRLAPIAGEPGREFTIETFAGGNHALVETQTGLTSEMLRSDTFAPGLFASVGRWLALKGFGETRSVPPNPSKIAPRWRAPSVFRPH
jgi:dienelactone hydrolase